MTKRQGVAVLSQGARAVLAGLVLVLGLAALPGSAWAITCAEVPAGSTVDTDGDGFTDAQECGGITTHGGTGVAQTFLPCIADSVREACVDPNTKDLFIVYKPAVTGSLLTGNAGLPANAVFPFGPVVDFPCDLTNAACNSVGPVQFQAFTALGITAHQLTPAQVGVAVGRNTTNERRVSPATGYTQKAVRVSESLDTSSPDILGYCTWGTPLGLDGCTIYTARIRNFINTKCAAAGDTGTDRNRVLLIYSAFLALHEAGHALGGLATTHVSAVGGYHYASTSGMIMSQAAEYSITDGRCRFFIPSAWNPILEIPGLKFK